MMPRHFHRVAWLGLAATVACGAPTTPPGNDPSVFVGAVTGTDAVVAVAVHNTDVAAYVCGGASSFATLTHWFTGALPASSSGSVDLMADGLTLHLTVASDGASGTLLDAQGMSRAFTASPRHQGTLEGLYTVIDEGCRTGVVILQPAASATPTVQGTWCALAGAERFQQVMPLMPVALVDGALRVQVQLASGSRTLAVQPVEVPLR